MARKIQFKKFDNDIISASEIGQYYFCANSWFLQKHGYKPISKNLKIGVEKHQQLGKIIDNLEKQNKKSNRYAIIGFLFLIIAILVFLFEVIL